LCDFAVKDIVKLPTVQLPTVQLDSLAFLAFSSYFYTNHFNMIKAMRLQVPNPKFHPPAGGPKSLQTSPNRPIAKSPNRPILFFLSLLLSTTLFAQNEANIWYFGKHCGLDFNSGVPVALHDGQT
jgi:hypothetical protein